MSIPPADPHALWQPAPPGLQLTEAHIDIWQHTTDVSPDRHAYLTSLLSCDEQQRASRLRDPLKRAESEVSRGLLRHLLSGLLNVGPHKLVFQFGPHGKPHLPDKYLDKSIGFNLSHTKGLILIAIGLNRDIGIDVEWIPPDYHWQPIARQFLSAAEVEHLFSLPPTEQCRAFFMEWVRSEAMLKAIGVGITQGLTLTKPSNPENEWSATDLDVGPAHTAAVAAESPYVLRLWK